MVKVRGNPNESWRSADSFWAKVSAEIDAENDLLVRKNLYMMWLENRRNLKSIYLSQQEISQEKRQRLKVCFFKRYLKFD